MICPERNGCAMHQHVHCDGQNCDHRVIFRSGDGDYYYHENLPGGGRKEHAPVICDSCDAILCKECAPVCPECIHRRQPEFS